MSRYLHTKCQYGGSYHLITVAFNSHCICVYKLIIVNSLLMLMIFWLAFKYLAFFMVGTPTVIITVVIVIMMRRVMKIR